MTAETKAKLLKLSCGDSGCTIMRRSGMATNGGCKCENYKLRQAVHILKAEIEVLNNTQK